MGASARVRVTGPLVPYVEGFAAKLRAEGYTDFSMANQLRLVAHTSVAGCLGRAFRSRSSAPRRWVSSFAIGGRRIRDSGPSGHWRPCSTSFAASAPCRPARLPRRRETAWSAAMSAT